MKTQITSHKKPLATAIEFAGFGDWFEIFRAGTQTDKNGKTREFTQADLDSMVANHSAAKPFPFCIGHPKENDPAYGWSSDLKRDGDSLYAKGRATVPEFETAVKNELFPNRSISVEPAENGGWKIRHLGWLGAKPPAVEGMQRLNFASSDNELVFEFSAWDEANAFSRIAGMFRRWREFVIDRFSLDDADRVLPDWEISSLADTATTLQSEALRETDKGRSNAFSQSKNSTMEIEEDVMSEKDKAEFAAAQAKASQLAEENKTLQEKLRAAEFARQVDACASTIQTLQKDGKLLPYQAQGLAEFAARLPGDEEAAFEFAAHDDANKKISKTPRAYFMEFLGSLGKQIELGRKDDDEPGAGDGASDYSAPAGYTVNAERAALDKKARDYAAKNGVDYITALRAIEGVN